MLEKNEPTAEFPSECKAGSVHMTQAYLKIVPSIHVFMCTAVVVQTELPRLQWRWFSWEAGPGMSLSLSSNMAPLESLSLLMSSPRFTLPIFLSPCFGF